MVTKNGNILMHFEIEYFHVRVQSAIEDWPAAVLADYVRLIEMLIEAGPQMRLPHSRALGAGLFELRPGGAGVEGRVLYAFLEGRRVVLLHAFLKKTQTTPDNELRIARRRLWSLHHG